MAFTPGATTTYNTSGAGSENNSVVNLPSHAAGDLLVAIISASANSATVNIPAGWASPSGGTEASSGNAARVLYRVADGTEGPTQTFTYNSFYALTVVIHAIAGADGTTPIGAYGASTGLGGTPTAPSVTGTAGHRRLFLGAYNIVGTAQTISGSTLRGDVVGNSSTRTEAALWTENTDLAGGSTGTQALDNGVFTYWVAVTLTLAPASAAAAGSIPPQRRRAALAQLVR